MSNIYDLVTTEENRYQTGIGVPLTDTWYWKMADHVKRSFLYKNSQFTDGSAEFGDRPFKNVIVPILNVAYRSEGFDVKDIEPYVNDEDDYYMSFLVRKFHEKWARKNDMDTFIDNVVETYVDYGGVLVKKVNKIAPEVIPWQQIAFCDQTDILSGTIAIKHSYTIEQLADTPKDLGWYTDAVDQAITYAKAEKANTQVKGNKQKTPQKNIDVYEIHGTFPEDWLTKENDTTDYNENLDPNKYSKQVHIITYVKGGNQTKTGLTLFKGKEKKSIFKFMARNPIFGRALGRGGIEELFEPQVWINFSEIHKMNMLKQASKIIYQTSDTAFTTRNDTRNAENGSVFVHDGNPATLLNNQAINFPDFEKATNDWELQARTVGSANDAQLGINPASGTPFALQNLVTATGQGMHEYQQGKIATFIGEIYRDWILDDLVAEMNQGNKWMDELSLEEMQTIADMVTDTAFADYAKQKILAGQVITQEMIEPMKAKFKQDFMKSPKKFFEIVKGELSEIPIEVDMNIAGKQKDLKIMADKLSNIVARIIANPQGFAQTMQIPAAAEAFNRLMESSGLSPINFQKFNLPQGQNNGQSVPSPVQLPQLTNQTQ